MKYLILKYQKKSKFYKIKIGKIDDQIHNLTNKIEILAIKTNQIELRDWEEDLRW